jgi:hypothetical protein
VSSESAISRILGRGGTKLCNGPEGGEWNRDGFMDVDMRILRQEHRIPLHIFISDNSCNLSPSLRLFRVWSAKFGPYFDCSENVLEQRSF